MPRCAASVAISSRIASKIHERLDYLCEALHFDFELIEPPHCGSVKRLHCTGVWWLHWRMHW
jgi:hypothetical protein